jgi:hypothetical protein
MLVAKLPGSMYATLATTAGPYTTSPRGRRFGVGRGMVRAPTGLRFSTP